MENLNEDFDLNGFVAIKKFFSLNDIAEIMAIVGQLVSGKLKNMSPEHVFYENKNDPSTLKQLQHLDFYDPFFRNLFAHTKIQSLAELLLNDAVVAKNMQWFNKPPKVGRETPPHQDGYYFMLEPNEAVTMWLALEQVDEENGCVRYIPGSHKKGMRPHGKTSLLGFSQGITDYSEEDFKQEIPMIVGPGDLIVHHSMTIHRADANFSQRNRKGLGFIFYSSQAREDQEKHRQYQEKLKKEMQQSGKI
ncbi:MAG: phytanoyl-CoA dioxygenase family protein [Cyclobacteriaceae bacterium]